jgi:hypothetical protein
MVWQFVSSLKQEHLPRALDAWLARYLFCKTVLDTPRATLREHRAHGPCPLWRFAMEDGTTNLLVARSAIASLSGVARWPYHQRGVRYVPMHDKTRFSFSHESLNVGSGGGVCTCARVRHWITMLHTNSGSVSDDDDDLCMFALSGIAVSNR